jgi:hypothetical protein
VKPICLQKGNDWDISLLLPFGDQMISALRRCRGLPNRASAVLRVVHHGGAVLIGADAPLGSWERLAHVETPESKQLSAEVFRIPHHGGSIREGKKLLERSELYQRVSAKIAVCSVGTQNPYGHPHEDHLRDACRGGACRLLCTELNSTCHKDPLSLRDKMLEKASGIVYPLRQLAAPGDGYLTRRGKLSVPCAGTILAEIDEKGHVAVSPSKGGWHDEMVALFDSPICREHLEKRQASSQRLGT